MKIIVIEDEIKVAKIIEIGLKAKGYFVDHVSNGNEAQKRIQSNPDLYDFIILDLILPNKGGLEICKEIRKLNIVTPILILTVNGNLKSKVSLFDAGADDYLVKPFKFPELFGRIQAVNRRPKKLLPTVLKISDVSLNPATLKVLRANREVKLTLKEFRILEYFMRNPGIVLSREDITSNIWDFNYDSFSNIVDVFVNKIRSKIDNGRVNKLIETVQGMGYKLNIYN